MKILVNSWQIFIQCRGSDGSRKKLFNLLWNQYQRRIIFFIQNMVKDNAEDLFQEVMLKVYQNLDKYNPLYSFNTWIYTIARNHCLNYLNKKKISTVNLDRGVGKYEVKDIDSPEAKSLNKELHQKIENLLGTFSEENRQIAFLRFYEGMKDRDIARVMEVPTGTVKSRLHKIRTILKKDLETFYE